MRGRGSVIKLDRFKKARSIHAILADHCGGAITGKRTLDIGCGNGGISEFFSETNVHSGVDVTDHRKNDDKRYTFHLVSNEILPFEDNEFDVVISNHVIEHVSDQQLHLKEILRVLKSNGCAYLATPNKSSPIMEGHVGNEMVLKYADMGPMIQQCGFVGKEYGVAVASRPEDFEGEVKWAKYIPASLLKLMRPFFPSHIFILSPSRTSKAIQGISQS